MQLTREQSLRTRPLGAVVATREDLPHGGQRIGVYVATSGIRKLLLRLPDQVLRTLELDTMGLDVLEMCDGKTTVKQIAKKFSKRHQLNEHEAQAAVIQFLRMAVGKGVVSMMVSAP